MKQRLVTQIATCILTVALIASPIFFVAPPKARAAGMPVFDATNIVQTTISAVKNTITANQSTINAINSAVTKVKAGISAAADVANQISLKMLVVDKFFIKPLAFVLSASLLKSMTSSVVSFAVGQSNGTGKPQFVQNVGGLMQQVGDKQASVFLTQLARTPNSPFAASVASSLRTNYLQQTSAAGFFAANQDTLSRVSPNVNAFLAGDWSKGGIGAWFALTTQPQNNPYLLYQNSQSQLGTLVGSAQTAKKAELDWGQGFLSWCGDLKSSAATDDFGLDAGVDYDTPNCTKSDGSPGTIQTPGSYIGSALAKAVGADQDKLVAAGEAGSEINSIFGKMASVLKNVNLASKLLGGASNTLGLAGAAQPSGANRNSILGDYFSTPGYAGATAQSVYKNASTLPAFGSELSDRIAKYKTAWDSISAAANTAQTSLTDLTRSCTSLPANVVTELASSVGSVLAQAATASATIAKATAAIQEVQGDLNSGSMDPDSFDNAMQALQIMSPTADEVAAAESNAQSSGLVTAGNVSSLTTSDLSLVDQMTLIGIKVQGLKSSCPMPESVQAP